MPTPTHHSALSSLVAPFAVMAAISLALGGFAPADAAAGGQVLADLPAASQTSSSSTSSGSSGTPSSGMPSSGSSGMPSSASSGMPSSGSSGMPSSTSSGMPSSASSGMPSSASSGTPTPTPSGTPTSTPQPPADPLAGLSKKERKAFSACLTRQVGAHSSGTCARLALSRLKKAGFYRWPVGSSIGVAGANALLNYQRSRGLTATATTTRQTWIALATKTKAVDADLPAKCLGSGVNLCVNQGRRTLYFLRDGKVIRTFKVRLGGYNSHPKTHKWRVFPTANGSWRVFDKQVNPKSENYGSGAMPYSVMFHPDMYVHYSPGFHADGYATSSHGCVNIGQLSEAIWIYKHTPVGARVTVFTPKRAA